MRTIFAYTRLTILGITILTILPACSSHKSGEATELHDKEEKERLEIALDTPESQLIEDGKKYFTSELYTLAKKNFESLRTGYPNSQYIDFAEIKIADCLYEMAQFADASKSYEDFVNRRPTHPSASYMLYRAAKSAQTAHTGVGRDPAPLKRAVELYDKVVSNYPNSEYKAAALQGKKETLELLLAHEQRIEKFYVKKDFTDAAKSRESLVKTQLIPVLSNLSETLEKDPTLASKESNQNEAPEGIELKDIENQAPSDTKPEPIKKSSPIKLISIECKSKIQRGVKLVFATSLSHEFINTFPSRIKNIDGIIRIQLQDIVLPDQLSSCFKVEDLALSHDGTISLKAFSDANIEFQDGNKTIFLAIP